MNAQKVSHNISVFISRTLRLSQQTWISLDDTSKGSRLILNQPSLFRFSICQETKDSRGRRGVLCGLWSRDREAWCQSQMAVQHKGHSQRQQIRDHSQWKQALPHYTNHHCGGCQCLRGDCWGFKGQVWAEGPIKARWDDFDAAAVCLGVTHQSNTEHLGAEKHRMLACFCTWTHILHSLITPPPTKSLNRLCLVYLCVQRFNNIYSALYVAVTTLPTNNNTCALLWAGEVVCLHLIRQISQRGETQWGAALVGPRVLQVSSDCSQVSAAHIRATLALSGRWPWPHASTLFPHE